MIFLNQVSGFVGVGSKLKDYVINTHDEFFHYSKQGPETILTGIKTLHGFDVTMEREKLQWRERNYNR